MKFHDSGFFLNTAKMAISMQSCVDLIIGGHEEHLHKWPFQRLLFKLCLHIIYMVAQEKGHMMQII